mmetsp:Transcript_29509/g.28667  ORF Transcript_29509/g.28667 Transcript_29509/m.28667 type:complete len:131 (+) Transcript_29509:1819-2211(+)
MKLALQTYQEENKGNLPDEIYFYRDGVGGPTMETKIREKEVNLVMSSIYQYQQGYKPGVLYCLVDKRISHRLFAQNGHMVNPPPGTCLDRGLVESQGAHLFDFFMIANHATVATALPVHYKVIANSTGLP